MRRSVFIEIISCLFILLFVYASLMKLKDVEQFVAQLNQSPLLMPFSKWVSWGIPSLELIIAAMLIFRRFRLIGLIASFTIMVMFTAYIVVILTYADHVPCSCGGILEKMGWTEHLIFNIGFVLLALVGVILQDKENELGTQTHPAGLEAAATEPA
jgi:uncharacterized membrane protein YphA (DoxX/SURF4 family)